MRTAEDPEAPVTVHGATRFPYRVEPRKLTRGGLALPDPGSVREIEQVVSPTSPLPGAGDERGLGGLLDFPRQGSNALLVSAAESESGRPIAVMGPQTAYFAPQLLMDVDVHAPTIDARGATFAGIGLYVLLGHGRDYAWSATSAGQDIVDTFALELCERDGSPASLDSTHYRFRGDCLPIEVLEKTNRWTPSPADDTAPGSETLHAERTKPGLVTARATVKGAPVIYASLRSTYFHEADSALGFVALGDPNAIKRPEDFKRAVARIGFTFNWFYADHSHIAYFNSGNNPVRARGTSTHFPVSGELEWNNKQARGYRAADDNFAYGSIYRSNSLSDRIRAGIRGERKM